MIIVLRGYDISAVLGKSFNDSITRLTGAKVLPKNVVHALSCTDARVRELRRRKPKKLHSWVSL